MACSLLNQKTIQIKIPGYETTDNVTFYTINVSIGDVNWTLKHRYSEFVVLHDILVTEHCVEKDILPPKKIIGRKNEAFIDKRRQALEIYLNAIYNYLKKTMPREFVIFLDLHVYDIFFLLQNMAFKFFNEGPNILQVKSYTFTPIQVIIFSTLKILFVLIL